MSFGEQMRKPMICRFALLGFVAAMLLLSSSFTAAATYSWSGSFDDWGNASNWGGIVPSSNDDAYITNGGTATISQFSPTCRYLYLGGSDTGAVQMTGGQLTTTSSYIGNQGTGVFSQSGGNYSAGDLYLGYTASSNGTYGLSGTGQLSAAHEYIGYSGTGIFSQSGGTNSPRTSKSACRGITP